MTNHYAPPQSAVNDVNRPGSGGITDAMLDAMRGTKPWVLLIGILLFISAAFIVLAAVGLMAAGTIGANKAGGPPAAAMLGMGAMYVVGAVIDVVMGIYLVKYNSAIGRLLESGSATDMEDALGSQRKFWKFAGVLALVMIVVSVIGMIAAIAVPILTMVK